MARPRTTTELNILRPLFSIAPCFPQNIYLEGRLQSVSQSAATTTVSYSTHTCSGRLTQSAIRAASEREQERSDGGFLLDPPTAQPPDQPTSNQPAHTRKRATQQPASTHARGPASNHPAHTRTRAGTGAQVG
eukprot:GHVU01206906.1.p1 GENE.GHVU01206906.1~~GHVU01206906.1.p1  ORF type:complete len:133 (-),score=12.05 GHVU01206906.1:367-765(-)